jgi:hypothetical protein
MVAGRALALGVRVDFTLESLEAAEHKPDNSVGMTARSTARDKIEVITKLTHSPAAAA